MIGKWGGGVLAAGLLATSLAAAPAAAQDVQAKQFKVVGSWGNLTNYNNVEKPFWNKTIVDASGGKITANITPLTELGLKGFEVLRLIKLGVFDFAYGVIGYVAEDPVFEGVDLSIMAQDIDTMRKLTEVYRPVLDRAFQQKFGAKLMAMLSYPSQMIFCKPPVNSLADLKGKKLRVYSTTLSDFADAVGATGVTVAFPEVVPALEKGVVDCGITGTMPAYDAKWYEVVTTVYPLRLGWGAAFFAGNLNVWNKMDAPTRAFLEKQFAAHEDAFWKNTAADDRDGIACNTGTAPCPKGPPGKMQLVQPTAGDIELRQRIMREFIIKRWAKRCGAACVADWNATIGKAIGETASVN
ncbi:MAG: TRAP transporter substrate-binding protein [Alphaproteobacteria bacterium]|nr:TRAP transporter substrate-binding protein [Alphaproteobacteria bacterium]